MEPFSALAFLGAIAIFLFGIRISRMGIQLLVGDQLRAIVGRMTKNRLSALFTGISVTLILQSSTATTVMLVGFAATGVITLAQAMGVILGADIGTTFVVILLSIQEIADSALLLLVVGVALDIISHKKKTRYLSMVLIGFGFVFFGMQLMIQKTIPLRENPLIAQIFAAIGQNTPYAFFLAAGFTALVQNSAATLGLALALAFSGTLTFEEALPMVLGANIGTCAASFFSSLGGGPLARQVAMSHLFFKSTGALIALLFLDQYAALMRWVSNLIPNASNHIAAQIALSHVFFNLGLSILFLPFIKQGAWLIRKMVPEPYRPEDLAFGPKYLDPKALEMPALAFANTKREILRMAEIAQNMFQRTITVFKTNDRELMSYIQDEDDKVDILDREVKFYLAKISQESLAPEQARMQLNLLALTSDLEEICDVINKNILELALKKIRKGRQFSEEGWEEIADVHAKVAENFQITISSLTTDDVTLVRKMSRHEDYLVELEDRYREAHLQRLHKGLQETIDTSSIHLDLLANLRRINSKLTTIVKTIVPSKDS